MHFGGRKIAVPDSRKVAKALGRLGFVEQGTHKGKRFVRNNLEVKGTFSGRNEVDATTLRNICTAAQVAPEEFVKLL